MWLLDAFLGRTPNPDVVTPTPFAVFERQLGENARLAISVSVLDNDNKMIGNNGYNSSMLMPSASTNKIITALCIARMLYQQDPTLSLETQVTLKKRAAHSYSPGEPSNPLDRFYFEPGEHEQTVTVEKLLNDMFEKSDNTAADTLLELVGGPEAVNLLVSELNLIDNTDCKFSINRFSRELLSVYYDVPYQQDDATEAGSFIVQFLTAFSMRPTEKAIFEDGKDSCTATFMSVLLECLINPSTRAAEHSWLPNAAELLQAKMQLCETGNEMIGEVANKYDDQIKSIGYKTGSLGGILNIVVNAELNDGRKIVSSVFSCFSTEPNKTKREQVIANVLTAIFDGVLAPSPQVQVADEEVHHAKFCSVQ